MVVTYDCSILSGDDSITQLFVEFQPFSWTVTFYTVYSCITGLLNSLAIVVCMVVFRKFFHISDNLTAFIGAICGVLYFFGFGIAWASWVLYIFAFVGAPRYLVIVCTRSILSQLGN